MTKKMPGPPPGKPLASSRLSMSASGKALLSLLPAALDDDDDAPSSSSSPGPANVAAAPRPVRRLSAYLLANWARSTDELYCLLEVAMDTQARRRDEQRSGCWERCPPPGGLLPSVHDLRV